MDDDALSIHNWGYYEPSPTFKGHHLSLQLMSTMAERDTKNFMHGRDPNTTMAASANGGFRQRDCGVSDTSIAMNYGRDNWMNSRDKYNLIPSSTTCSTMLLDNSVAHNSQTVQYQNPEREARVIKVEEEPVLPEGSKSNKRQCSATTKTPKQKKGRKARDNSNNGAVQRVKPPKKGLEVVINGIGLDISGIPIPICSCSGVSQQCYRWGCGGWQSACCTTNVSMYPLPMSTKRRGARIAGRKMSQGAFKKVLEKLAAEGYNFVNPIDLRTHWAKHGTNKFVTIR